MTRFFPDYDLSASNTFRLKLRCALYVEYDSSSDLASLDWEALPKPVRHIGEGSNLLFTGDFSGTILHGGSSDIKYVDMGLDEVPVMVGAGVKWDRFVEQTCGYGLWGAENLSLIPGQTGAAAVQNIGAYGVEIADIVSGVVCFDTVERCKRKFSVSECSYSYRDSLFKRERGRYIVTSVLVRLSRRFNPRLDYKGVREALSLREGQVPQDLTPARVREAIIKVRRDKLPDPAQTGSAGSFFKNPVISAGQFADLIDAARGAFGPDVVIPHFVLPSGEVKVPAAWLIDKGGFKGACEGGAAVWEKQPLVIVNANGCASSEDILSLERRIVDGVRGMFGVTLNPEVEHI